MEPADIHEALEALTPSVTDDAEKQNLLDPIAEKFPEKFKDAEGKPRIEALLKSYLELERKVATMLPAPCDEHDHGAKERLWSALGRPKAPEDYQIERRCDWLDRDPAIDGELHRAGFSNAQAQLVYDLAAQRVGPVLLAAIDEIEAERRTGAERQRLVEHFGGAERWQALSRQLNSFGERHLAGDVFQALTRSYDGVLALHAMMRAKEPELLSGDPMDGGAPDEGRLTQMMRDPRYWRDRDKDFVARVTDGFRRLYGG